ncbi:MAG: AmmeMemoRadiSam system protein B [Planctomycetota bacterium]
MTDPSGIAPNGLTLSQDALFIVALMNGRRTHPDIQAEFMRSQGHMLFSDELDMIIRQLDEARFLEGPSFDAHIAKLTRQYREAPARPLRDKNTLGAPEERLPEYFDAMLAEAARGHTTTDRVLGIIAPHLDYARGAPCYAPAYASLAHRTGATRFVILGTNHFGLSSCVVGTRQAFETPWGNVPADTVFMRRLDDRCGADLCEGEYDHAREHSIELQVLLLRHVMAGRDITIAAYLCPDPCGPTGTRPANGRGVDLDSFAAALRDEIEEDDVPTCLIAGADLSHVGRFFGDDRELDADTLHAVEASDRQAIDHLLDADAESFRNCIASTENATHICSAGSIYTLTMALHGRARPRLLHYHQAVTKEAHNCVTCCALEFTAPPP